MLRLFFFACLLTVALGTFGNNTAVAQTWNLPQHVSDKNSTVNFEVDSTWHLVEGKTSGVHGVVELKDPADFKSIVAEINFPVARFDTDNSDRDTELRQVMAEDKFKEVSLKVLAVDNLPTPEIVQQKPQQVKLNGTLSIRGMTREVSIPANLSFKKGKYKITGKFKFPWAAFGVEDPSILVAKVYPDVLVKFELNLI